MQMWQKLHRNFVSWEIWDLLVGDVEHILKNVVQLMKGKNASIVENLVLMGA